MPYPHELLDAASTVRLVEASLAADAGFTADDVECSSRRQGHRPTCPDGRRRPIHRDDGRAVVGASGGCRHQRPEFPVRHPRRPHGSRVTACGQVSTLIGGPDDLRVEIHDTPADDCALASRGYRSSSVE